MTDYRTHGGYTIRNIIQVILIAFYRYTVFVPQSKKMGDCWTSPQGYLPLLWNLSLDTWLFKFILSKDSLLRSVLFAEGRTHACVLSTKGGGKQNLLEETVKIGVFFFLFMFGRIYQWNQLVLVVTFFSSFELLDKYL